MLRSVCCGLALTATLLAATPAWADFIIQFPAPTPATALSSPMDTVSIFGTYTNPTGIAPFAAAPFVLSFGLPSQVQVGAGNGSFSLSGIAGSYTNNGSVTDFSGATVNVLTSSNLDNFGEINLNATPFLVPTGVFSLSVLTIPALFGYDSTTGVATMTLGIFGLDSGQASYGLDPSIGSSEAGVSVSQQLPEPVPEPPAWPMMLAGCLGIAALRLPRRKVST